MKFYSDLFIFTSTLSDFFRTNLDSVRESVVMISYDPKHFYWLKMKILLFWAFIYVNGPYSSIWLLSITVHTFSDGVEKNFIPHYICCLELPNKLLIES